MHSGYDTGDPTSNNARLRLSYMRASDQASRNWGSLRGLAANENRRPDGRLFDDFWTVC